MCSKLMFHYVLTTYHVHTGEEQGTRNIGEPWFLTSPSHYNAFDEFIMSGLTNDFERQVSALLKAC